MNVSSRLNQLISDAKYRCIYKGLVGLRWAITNRDWQRRKASCQLNRAQRVYETIIHL